MGLVAAVLGMGLAAGDGAGMAAAFYAAHHVLAKGALFLAIGVVAATGARRLWPVLLPAAVLALGFGGLPLTGGVLAKLAVKDTLGEGVAGLLATLAARRQHAADAALPAASAPGGRCRRRRRRLPGLVAAVAGDGLRCRRGALGALSQRRHRQPGRGPCAGSAVGRALAGAARRRARRPPAPLGRPSAAGAGGRHRGDRRARRARRLRPWASRWRAPRACCSAGRSPASPCSRSCSSSARPCWPALARRSRSPTRRAAASVARPHIGLNTVFALPDAVALHLIGLDRALPQGA